VQDSRKRIREGNELSISEGRRLQRIGNTFGPILGLVLIYLFFVLIGPSSFFSVRNLETIARQTAIVGTAALGMTLIIIAGGIDLSAGSVVAFSTVVIAWLLQKMQMDPLPAALAGVAAGGFCGLLNGLFITRLQVVPFIVTLGMMLLVRGAAKGLAGEQKIDAPISWLNELMAALPQGQRWMLVPWGVWILIVMAAVMVLVLRYTVLGRYIYAIGSNEQTARLCGVAVNRVKTYIYTLSGCLVGLAGLMQFSRLTVGDPTVAVGLELDVIAAVVIGGGSLSGGEGSVPGTLIGALIMTVIRSGCSQMGLPNWVQEIITGSIIVIAVTLDRLRRRKYNV
jgi:ribose/xylose/arabinose/galactoside ABC-type transport system permease subunit